MSAAIDLMFPVLGNTVPSHHAYSLFGAICRLIPAFHQHPSIGIFSLSGTPAAPGVIQLSPNATLRLRLPAEDVPSALVLAGKALNLDKHEVRLGTPRVAGLIPAPSLQARVVVIKISGATGKEVTPESFLAAARRQFAGEEDASSKDATPSALRLAMSEQVSIAIPRHAQGPRVGEPIRRIVRVKEQTHVGFPLIVSGLSADESLTLQTHGLGGRRKMGCGLFLPVR